MEKLQEYTILVVEDEADIREIIVDILEETGFQVIEAENGRVGFEKAKTESIDAIVSDIKMPEMTGLEFLAALRKDGIETPFVVLSAFADKSNTVEALRLNAMDFLDKPIDEEALVNTMKKAVLANKKQNELEQQLEKVVEESDLSDEDRKKYRAAKKALLELQAMKKGKLIDE